MPKAKTRKSAAKRFKVTASGKYLSRRSGKSHLNEWKKSKRTRSMRKLKVISKAMVHLIKRMLPWS